MTNEEVQHAKEGTQRGADHRCTEAVREWGQSGDICRKLALSEATFYTWKKQYTGLGVQDSCGRRTVG